MASRNIDPSGIRRTTNTKLPLAPLLRLLVSLLLGTTSVPGCWLSVISFLVAKPNTTSTTTTTMNGVAVHGCFAFSSGPSVSGTFQRPRQRRTTRSQAPSFVDKFDEFAFAKHSPTTLAATTTRTAFSSEDEIRSSAARTTTATTSTMIEWIPTRIEFEGVYRSYGPPSLWRKLTSSVPRREFALRDITLAFGKPPERATTNPSKHATEIETESKRCNNTKNSSSAEDAFCLLLGASSSGKSTIFRSILEAREEGAASENESKEFDRAGNKGSLRISRIRQEQPLAVALPGQSGADRTTAIPILLDDRGEVNTASGRPKTLTLREAWNESARQTIPSSRTTKINNDGDDDDDDETNRIEAASSLVNLLADAIFDLDPEALLVDLTPSEMYRFCLGKACIESSFGAISDTAFNDNDDKNNNNNNNYRCGLPGPILLLDEWMDVETSAVVRKVQPSLHKIVEELNGIVLSITHKPELYSGGSGGSPSAIDASAVRRITLSAGKLLSEF